MKKLKKFLTGNKYGFAIIIIICITINSLLYGFESAIENFAIPLTICGIYLIKLLLTSIFTFKLPNFKTVAWVLYVLFYVIYTGWTVLMTITYIVTELL